MNYERFHAVLLVLGFCAAIGAAIAAVFFFGVALQAAGVVAILVLLWIGWELHRIAQLAVNFVRGYEDAIAARKRAAGE